MRKPVPKYDPNGFCTRSRHTAGAIAVTLVRVAIRFTTWPTGMVRSSKNSNASGSVTLSLKATESPSLGMGSALTGAVALASNALRNATWGFFGNLSRAARTT